MLYLSDSFSPKHDPQTHMPGNTGTPERLPAIERALRDRDWVL